MRTPFYYTLIIFILAACASMSTEKPAVTSDAVQSCLYKVYNRGTIPFSLVEDVLSAIKETPEAVFEPNSNFDVYSSVADKLGPYRDLRHRKAVMANVMLVQAMYESSGKYGTGRDTNANNTSACTEEAGLYQTSGNMNTYLKPRQELIDFQALHCKSTTCAEFKRCTKEPVKAFVHGHFIRASRITVKHWGPMVRKEINPWLKTACVNAIEALL